MGGRLALPRPVLLLAATLLILVEKPLAQREDSDLYADAVVVLENAALLGVKDRREALRRIEPTILDVEDDDLRATLLVWAADLHRDIGSYEAERLYEEAARAAPDDPRVLESAGRYFRLFRGKKGLYEEARHFYARGERRVDEEIAELKANLKDENRSDRQDTLAAIQELEVLREAIRRGEVELQKREGYALWDPFRSDSGFTASYWTSANSGTFPFPHNELATPTLAILKVDPAFDSINMLRDRRVDRQTHRLRFRAGQLPWLDVFWIGIGETDAIASQTSPVTFSNVQVSELGVALEGDANLAPIGDLLWRAQYSITDFEVENAADEDITRWLGSVVWTRNFGRAKVDLELLGSSATVEPEMAPTDDEDSLYAGTVRVQYNPQERNYKDRIEPRGYEYAAGVVRHTREFGPSVELFRDVAFASAKIREVLPRTDIEVLPNLFDTRVEGKPDEDSRSLETNVILTHRLIDRVNEVRPHRTDRWLGLAQWSVSARAFDDEALGDLEDFESWGGEVSSFLEIYSGPLSRSTLIFEVAYEYRSYHRLDQEEGYLRFGFSLGIP